MKWQHFSKLKLQTVLKTVYKKWILAIFAPIQEVTQVFLTRTLIITPFPKCWIFTHFAAVLIIISRRTFFKINNIFFLSVQFLLYWFKKIFPSLSRPLKFVKDFRWRFEKNKSIIYINPCQARRRYILTFGTTFSWFVYMRVEQIGIQEGGGGWVNLYLFLSY